MKPYFYLLLVLIIVLAVIGLMVNNKQLTKVCFNEHCFNAEVAATPKQRAQGLMFRENLGVDKAMLFVFADEKERSFWMKNTLIPLDIIWLNQNKEVVFIKHNALPCDSDLCESIKPAAKAQYVLELNAGTAASINLQAGDRVSF